MAKTYTLYSTSIKGGKRYGWNDGYWKNYVLSGAEGADRKVGGGGSLESYFYATYIMFNQSELAALRSKNIQSITLNVVVASGLVPASGTTALGVGYKYSDAAGSSSDSNAWARGNAASTGYEFSEVGYLRSTGGAYTANNTPVSISLSGSIPVYGYVLGPTMYTINLTPALTSSATLVVVTDEPDNYTVTYDANSGTGAPPAQTFPVGSSVTLSNAVPTRTGHRFLGSSFGAFPCRSGS